MDLIGEASESLLPGQASRRYGAIAGEGMLMAAISSFLESFQHWVKDERSAHRCIVIFMVGLSRIPWQGLGLLSILMMILESKR